MALNREAVVAAAEKLVARGKIDSAIKEYRKLVAENPTDATTLNRLGDLYVRIDRNEEAVKLFTQIAERYTEDGFFVKAIAIFKKIIKLDPTRLPVYERLAELYHKQGLVSEARTQYQVLVDYYLKHGKVDSAESVLRKMTALDSGDPSPHVKLAEIFHGRGDHDGELQEYKLLAEMMLRHKRVDEATQVYAKAIAASPNDLGFITDAVLGLKDAGHLGAAAKLLALAVERNPAAEKIARIAGLSKDKRGDAATTGVRRPPGEEAPRVYKVSDVASAPPELRNVPPAVKPTLSSTAIPRPEPPRVEPSRPAELLPSIDDEIEIEFPEFEAPPASEIRPTPEMLDRLPTSPWFQAGAGAGGAGVETPSPKAAPLPLPEESVDWSFAPEPELELDLELPKPAEGSPRGVALDFEALESASFEVSRPVPSKTRRLGDLLAEAEVFRKYGLGEKAHDRVREILKEDARHPGALALVLALWLDEGKFDRALGRAQELHKLSGEVTAAGQLWDSARPRLEKLGFGFADGRPATAPVPKKAKKDAVSTLLDELAVPKKGPKPAAAPRAAAAPPIEIPLPPPAPAKPKAPAKPAPDLSALVEELRPPKAKPAPPAAAPPKVAAAPPVAPVEPPPVAAAPPSGPPAGAGELEEAIEDRLAWLDEAAARAAAPKTTSEAARRAAGDELFAEEEGFFDLAAEIEEELTQEEIETGKDLLPREEPSLEEIVEGFKKGVAESLSPEDYDTHFNLGIAYREMGLIDEAIGEFQLAAKHESYLLDCCSLLGGCFLEKGLPELAIKWYQRGLSTPNLKEEGNLGLLYDLGNLYMAIGDTDRARRTFVELYGINSNYRDAVAKLAELGPH
jgi:pentatricopeptide repeat protein